MIISVATTFMKHTLRPHRLVAILSTAGLSASALTYDISIQGTDAIWLAGRTDLLPIPAYTGAVVPGWAFGRHGAGTPEMLPETYPPMLPVWGGALVEVLSQGVGGVSYFNGFGGTQYGPDGNNPTSSLNAIGGISGYMGTEGALVGVFLDDSIPNGAPPATLDFKPAAARDFLNLAPGIGQVFFIGDGLNSGAQFQSFTAPAGATRLFLGIPDGFGFNGNPGAYDDNDGGFRIQLGVVPEGETWAAGALLVAGLASWSWRSRRRA